MQGKKLQKSTAVRLTARGGGGRRADSVSSNVGNDLRNTASQVVPTMVPSTSHQSASSCTNDVTDLSFLVESWPALPAAVKAGIIAMVRAIDGPSSDDDSTLEDSDHTNRSERQKA